MKWQTLYAIGLGLLIPLLCFVVIVDLLPGDYFVNYAKDYAEIEAELSKAKSSEDRFYILPKVAKLAFNVGEYNKTRLYALELIALSDQFKDNWNYGNAIHDGHMVFGRLALLDGNVEKAKDFLIKAGSTPGSATLDSFGPNMSLARDLVREGHKEVVLEYFELCRQFWKLDFGKLSRWAFYINLGITPGFGANLKY